MKLFVILFLFCSLSFAKSYTIYTENNPPWNYQADGKLQGISVEVFKLIQQKVGNDDPIHLVPWNRGYRETLNKPNHILFLTARIDQREELFEWVGPVVADRVFLYEHIGNPQNVQTFEDAKRVATIDAGTKTNAAHMILKEMGFTNLSEFSQDIADIDLLQNHRVSLSALGEYAIQSNAHSKKLQIDAFIQTPLLIYEYPLYIAFSKGSDPKVIQRWQQALDTIKKEGLLEQIIAKEFTKMKGKR